MTAATGASLLALAIAAGGQDRATNTVSELEHIEQALAAAWKKGDCNAWSANIAPEWSVIHITGDVITRSDALKLCAGEQTPMESFTIDQVAVRVFGDAAVVTGRTTIRTGGATSEPVMLRFTDVFVRRAQRWLVVASQATRLAS